MEGVQDRGGRLCVCVCRGKSLAPVSCDRVWPRSSRGSHEKNACMCKHVSHAPTCILLNPSPSPHPLTPGTPAIIALAGKASPELTDTSTSCRPPHIPSVTPASAARAVTVEEAPVPVEGVVVGEEAAGRRRSAVNSRAVRRGPAGCERRTDRIHFKACSG